MIIDINYRELAGLLKTKVSLENLVSKLSMFGTPVEEFSKDTIKLEVFPNRLDMLSPEGIARSLNGFLQADIGYPLWRIEPSKTEVNVKSSSVRPFVSFSEVADVKLSPEALKGIMQMQEKLHETVGRDRRKYSIGIYDLQKITPPITYEDMPLKEISFTPLDASSEMTGKEILESHEKGVKYAHLIKGKKAPVLKDSTGKILSMAPIINSEECKVTGKTKNIFIDSTGTSQGTRDVVALVATSLAEREGKLRVLLPGPSFLPRRIKVSREYVNRIVGLDLGKNEFIRCLNQMRLGYDGEVLVPPYRMDIFGPIDVAEDVAIAHGYDKFEGALHPTKSPGKPLKSSTIANEARKIMTGYGFLELKTVMLTSPELLEMAGGHEVAVNNPKNMNYSALRQSLLPLVFDVLSINKKSEYPQKLFEVGTVFVPSEEKRIAGIIAHSEAGFSEIKGVVDGFTKLFGSDAEWSSGEHPFFMKGRTAVSELGVYGEVAPSISEKIGVPMAGFELDLERIL